jgi:hypothetical protein
MSRSKGLRGLLAEIPTGDGRDEPSSCDVGRPVLSPTGAEWRVLSERTYGRPNLVGVLDAGELGRAMALLDVVGDIEVGPGAPPADMAGE